MTDGEPNLILGGKYRLVKPIGRGGMGSVWQAEHVEWKAPIALKLVNLPSRHENNADNLDEALKQRFLSEVKTAAAIRSPHVVQILDHGIDPTLCQPYIAMELLDGETLESRLVRRGRLEASETVQLLSQVAKALTRLHEANVVHRDLKPSNVFIVHNDGEDLAKLLDFGIAKVATDALDQRPLTETGEQLGTPFYMSPEQIRGMRDVDFRADIWAFGVIGFECLTGVRPFQGSTLGDLSLKICAEPIVNPSHFAAVPRSFDDWFQRCVHRERELTFGSAREAAEALKVALRAHGERPARMSAELQSRAEAALAPTARLDTDPASNTPLPSEPRTRRVRVWLVGSTVALGAALITGWWLRASAHERAETPPTRPPPAGTLPMTTPPPSPVEQVLDLATTATPPASTSPVGKHSPASAPLPPATNKARPARASGAHPTSSHLPAAVKAPLEPARGTTPPVSGPAKPNAPSPAHDLIQDRH